MHSATNNVQQLRHDLWNGPAHVFGDHKNCNSQFCQHSVVQFNPADDRQISEEEAVEPMSSDFQD